jgi:hypothetical protein
LEQVDGFNWNAWTISSEYAAGQYRPQYTTPSEVVEKHGNSLTKELWFRQVVSPPLQKSCYSSEEVCDSVDNMVEIYDNYSHPNWSEYLTTIVISLLLSFPGVLFAWRYTCPFPDESQIEKMKGH